MLNYIWFGLIMLSVVMAGITGQFASMMTEAFSSAKVAVMSLALPLAGTIMIMLGFMRLAERSGLIKIVARIIRPLMSRLFPEVPADHPAMTAIIMSMAANVLGLGNAATPFGLVAMEQLNKLNPHKGVATNSMCMFLAINTSSVTLLPTTAIAILAAQGASDPSSIIGTAIFATVCSTIAAIIAVRFFQRLPYFRMAAVAAVAAEKTKAATAEAGDGDEISVAGEEEADSDGFTRRPLGRGGKITLALFAFLVIGFVYLEVVPAHRTALLEGTGFAELQSESDARSARFAAAKGGFDVDAAEAEVKSDAYGRLMSMVLPVVFGFFCLFAIVRGVKVYEDFVDGAKEGFQVVIRVMPYLVAMMIALAMFRNSGALLLAEWALAPLLAFLQFPVELLPMALVRPLSGSGALGVMGELVFTHGPDSLIAKTAATMQGSTETTFYVLALYFGSVGVYRVRHALIAGLIADTVGLLSAVFICRVVFG